MAQHFSFIAVSIHIFTHMNIDSKSSFLLRLTDMVGLPPSLLYWSTVTLFLLPPDKRTVCHV